jgi:hypothetical protein
MAGKRADCDLKRDLNCREAEIAGDDDIAV